jgi:phosphatidylinositol glycan class V
MLTILLKSGTEIMHEPSRGLRAMVPGTDEQCRLLVRTLAVVQTLLAVLAITNYHVQIISRLSSGYPVWYWWVASCLMDKQRQSLGYGVVVFITMYAAIQGGLFASFLPPA